MAIRKRAPLTVDISAIGDKKLARSLGKIKLRLQKKIVKNALKRAAKEKLKPAVDANIAVVSPGEFGTGMLRRLKTKVTMLKPWRGNTIFGARVNTPSREKLGIPGGAKHYYPAILEYGDSSRGMEPQRMLRKAKEQKAFIITKAVARFIGEGIEKEVRKLGAGANR